MVFHMTSTDLIQPVEIPVTRKHRWVGERRVPACDSVDGNERTERGCGLCGIVKITVHPPHGLPWREWRTAKGEQLKQTATPKCEGEALKQ